MFRSFLLGYWQEMLKFTLESYTDEGIVHSYWPISSSKTPTEQEKIRSEKGKQIFRKYINENGRPDVIHVHSFLAGELALWIKQEFEIPYVITEHSSSFERKLLSESDLKLAYEVFENSHTNIAVSQSLSNAINIILTTYNFRLFQHCRHRLF